MLEKNGATHIPSGEGMKLDGAVGSAVVGREGAVGAAMGAGVSETWEV